MVERLIALAVLVATLALTFGSASAQAPDHSAVPAAFAAADLTQMSLEQLMELPVLTVVTASKREQKTTEAPAQATVVTAEDIRTYGHRTLADILRSVPGFYTTYDRSYSFVGVRGFGRPGDYGGRTLLLLDGHRMNDPLYDTASIGTDFMLDVDLIERVEVIRGPGSALYGNNAFFAVVNVITRKAAGINGGEASAEAGTYDTYKGRLTYGARTSHGTEIVASASGFRSQGNPSLYYADYDSPETGNGVVHDGDGGEFESVFGSVRRGGLSFEAAYVARDKDNPAPQYGTAFGMPVQTFDGRGVLEGRYERAIRDNLQAAVRIYYDWYEYRGDYAYDVAEAGAPAEIVINRDESFLESFGGEVQLNWRVSARHNATFGAEYRLDFREEVRNFDVSPRSD
jgi:outer membrane receptor for ferrienterochelin and colicins